MKYLNMATGAVEDGDELRRIFREEYDGDDPTNPISFNEWLNGYHISTDKDGKPYKNIYAPISED